jgi:hypothetical protein
MAPTLEVKAESQDSGLGFYHASRLNADQVAAWREFAARVPWAHYSQDPIWAAAKHDSKATRYGEPWFFWAERQGAICLTAIGTRRRLPIPRGIFWQFGKGPEFLDVGVLDEWISWFLSSVCRGAARVCMAPAMPLRSGGDDVETVLERHRFVRRRVRGSWATLLVDISRTEDQILAAFRPATQRSIKKSLRLGIEVQPEDRPSGWAAIAGLQTELGRAAPVSMLDLPAMERLSRHWLQGGAGGTVLVARYQNEPVAAALVVTYRGTAYLPIIPSSRRHRELPATHLLVWEAIRWARQQGNTTLDLEGYSLVARPGEPLWGINQFKRGFSSLDQVTKSVAVHERVFSPVAVALAGAGIRSRAWLHRHRGQGRSSEPRNGEWNLP